MGHSVGDMRDDAPDAEERATEWSLSVSSPDMAGTLPQVSASVSRRRQIRWGDFSERTAKSVGVTVDEVVARLTEPGDDAGISLLEQAAEAAIRASDRHKIAILARVAAAAFSGDDAKIQRARIVLPTVIELEPPHIRALVAFSTLGHRLNSKKLATALGTEDEAGALALIAQLVARGALFHVGSVFGAMLAEYELSEFGRQVLEYLGEPD